MRRSIYSLVLSLGLFGASLSSGQAAELVIKPDPANPLAFDTKAFTVKAGEAVKITLDNQSAVPQPHNFIVVKPGTLQAVGALANAMLADPQAAAKNYVPESPDILFSSKLVQPGGKDVLEFTAPSEKGAYQFLCTFPGHWMLMQGTMTVE